IFNSRFPHETRHDPNYAGSSNEQISLETMHADRSPIPFICPGDPDEDFQLIGGPPASNLDTNVEHITALATQNPSPLVNTALLYAPLGQGCSRTPSSLAGSSSPVDSAANSITCSIFDSEGHAPNLQANTTASDSLQALNKCSTKWDSDSDTVSLQPHFCTKYEKLENEGWKDIRAQLPESWMWDVDYHSFQNKDRGCWTCTLTDPDNPKDFPLTIAGDLVIILALFYLPYKYGGLRVCYIPQSMSPTIRPIGTETIGNWNKHVEIWAGNKKIGSIGKTFDLDAIRYPSGFMHDITLIKPTNPSMLRDIQTPNSLRQQSNTAAKSLKTNYLSKVLVIREAIYTDGPREDGLVGLGVVGFQSFVQRSGYKRLKLERVAFYRAF
ncbi:hypothetical protein K469DRAFT_714836, partial [Zopfia rhizophila CBS 207.26]